MKLPDTNGDWEVYQIGNGEEFRVYKRIQPKAEDKRREMTDAKDKGQEILQVTMDSLKESIKHLRSCNTILINETHDKDKRIADLEAEVNRLFNETIDLTTVNAELDSANIKAEQRGAIQFLKWFSVRQPIQEPIAEILVAYYDWQRSLNSKEGTSDEATGE